MEAKLEFRRESEGTEGRENSEPKSVASVEVAALVLLYNQRGSKEVLDRADCELMSEKSPRNLELHSSVSEKRPRSLELTSSEDSAELTKVHNSDSEMSSLLAKTSLFRKIRSRMNLSKKEDCSLLVKLTSLDCQAELSQHAQGVRGGWRKDGGFSRDTVSLGWDWTSAENLRGLGLK